MTDRTFGNFLKFTSYLLVAGGISKLLSAYGGTLLSIASTSHLTRGVTAYGLVIVALAVVCSIIGNTAASINKLDTVAVGLKKHFIHFIGCLCLGLAVCINLQDNNHFLEGLIVLVGVAASSYATTYYHTFSTKRLSQWSNAPKVMRRHENLSYNLAFGCICITSGFIGVGVQTNAIPVDTTVYAAGYMVYLSAYLVLFRGLPKNTMTGSDVGIFLNTAVIGAAMTGAAVFVAAYREAPVRQILILIALFGMILLIFIANLYFRYQKREMPSSNEH